MTPAIPAIPQLAAAERSLTPEIREWLGNLSDDALSGIAMVIGTIVYQRTGRRVHLDLAGLTFTISRGRKGKRGGK